MGQLEEIIQKLEEKILELEIVIDQDTISEISEIVEDTTRIAIPHKLKKFFQQFKILIEEIKKNEIPLDQDTLFVLKLLLRDIQTEEKGETSLIEEEEYILLKEFLKEGKELFHTLKEDTENAPSLLHRLKGILGIFLNICKEDEKELGKTLLEKTKELEKRSKSNLLSREEIKDLENLFDRIRKRYEKV